MHHDVVLTDLVPQDDIVLQSLTKLLVALFKRKEIIKELKHNNLKRITS